MTPLLSWITIVLALTFVGLLLRWLSEVEQRNDAKLRARNAGKSNSANSAANTAENAPDAPLAQVLELSPAVSQRHLSLVPAPAREGSEDLYDWRVQGL